MEKKVFKNELEELYLRTLVAGNNNIVDLKNKLRCISPKTFIKITQSLYFRLIIKIENNNIIISNNMKVLIEYLFKRQIQVIDNIDKEKISKILYDINSKYQIDVTNEMLILLS